MGRQPPPWTDEFYGKCFSILCRLTHSLCKSRRSKISLSSQEGKMRSRWGSRRAKVLSRLKFKVRCSKYLYTFCVFGQEKANKLNCWSNLSLLVRIVDMRLVVFPLTYFGYLFVKFPNGWTGFFCQLIILFRFNLF
jgi:hypothetical protein